MAPAGSAASRQKRGAAPLSEVSGKAKTIIFHGVKLKLPPTVKFRVLRQMSPSERRNIDLVGALATILGEEQMESVWEIDVPMNGTPMHEALADELDRLADKVFEAYGVGAGESQASPGS